MTDPTIDPQRRETIGRFFAAIESGDYALLQEVLTPDAITRWPQSGERMTGAMSCVQVLKTTRASRRPTPCSGSRARETCGSRSWWLTTAMDAGTRSASSGFDGVQIARMTDYFGPSLPAPEWRAAWVERDDVTPLA